jgi:hypothetical protein
MLGAEIVLDVDHDNRGVRPENFLAERGQRLDMRNPPGGRKVFRLCIHPRSPLTARFQPENIPEPAASHIISVSDDRNELDKSIVLLRAIGYSTEKMSVFEFPKPPISVVLDV